MDKYKVPDVYDPHLSAYVISKRIYCAILEYDIFNNAISMRKKNQKKREQKKRTLLKKLHPVSVISDTSTPITIRTTPIVPGATLKK